MVVPKALREQLNLRGGEEVEITLRDGEIVIAAAPTPMRFDPATGQIVVDADVEMSILSVEDVRDVLERVRR